MKKLSFVNCFLLFVAAITALQAYAYDSDHTDYIIYVQSHYSQGGLNSFGFKTMPPGCSSSQMQPHASASLEAREAMLNVAMAAYLSGKKVKAFYTLSNSCRVEYLRILD